MYSLGNEGEKFVGFSLKPLHCRDPALPHCTAIYPSAIFRYAKKHACATTTCAFGEQRWLSSPCWYVASRKASPREATCTCAYAPRVCFSLYMHPNSTFAHSLNSVHSWTQRTSTAAYNFSREHRAIGCHKNRNGHVHIEHSCGENFTVFISIYLDYMCAVQRVTEAWSVLCGKHNLFCSEEKCGAFLQWVQV